MILYVCILQFFVLGALPISQAHKLSALADALQRLKRDRGDMFTDAGGPLASSSKNGTGNPNAPVSVNLDLDNFGGGNCVWQSKPKQVLRDIAEELPNEKSFRYLGRGNCNGQSDCSSLCTSNKCNYYFKSALNGVMYMYSVPETKFAETDWDKSMTYDSFVLKCASG